MSEKDIFSKFRKKLRSIPEKEIEQSPNTDKTFCETCKKNTIQNFNFEKDQWICRECKGVVS